MLSHGFIDLADLLPDAWLLASGPGEVRMANEAAAQLLGIPAADLAGRSLTELAVGDGEEFARYLRSCARSRRLMPGRVTLRTSDGRRIDLRADGASFGPREGDSEALVALRLRLQKRTVSQFTLLNQRIAELGREIARRHRAEGDLELALQREREARAAAEAANQTKDEFLATVSHELRSPLQAIANWSYLLRSRPRDPAAVEHGLEIIERNLELQTQVIDDLLDFSHITTGQVEIERRPVDLAPLVGSACEDMRPAIEKKGVRLHVDVDTRAPRVSGDSTRLRQVMVILLSNALKFTGEGRIEVRLENAADGARIVVSDTGEGVEPAKLPHVFESFFQADGTYARKHGGLGLGLTIAHRLIELHGGTIAAASPGVGKGTTFIVTLPAT